MWWTKFDSFKILSRFRSKTFKQLKSVPWWKKVESLSGPTLSVGYTCFPHRLQCCFEFIPLLSSEWPKRFLLDRYSILCLLFDIWKKVFIGEWISKIVKKFEIDEHKRRKKRGKSNVCIIFVRDESSSSFHINIGISEKVKSEKKKHLSVGGWIEMNTTNSYQNDNRFPYSSRYSYSRQTV